MSTIPPGIKYCKFDPAFKTNTQYVCYENEICCPQGCCSAYSYKYFQSWYFWAAILLVFSLFYAFSWYCKKSERFRRLRNNRNRNAASAVSSDITTPRNNNAEDDVDSILEQLIQSYRNRYIHHQNVSFPYTPSLPKDATTTREPPPKYSVALTMPKPKCCRAHGSGRHIVQIHTGLRPDNQRSCSSSQRGSTTGQINTIIEEEQVPSYEDATKVTSNRSNEGRNSR